MWQYSYDSSENIIYSQYATYRNSIGIEEIDEIYVKSYIVDVFFPLE